MAISYPKRLLDAYYYRTKGFYIFCIPVAVPYKKVYDRADAAGYKKKAAFGPILEYGPMFGFGWIGVEIAKPKQTSADTVHIKGEFNTYEHKGPYRTLGQAYKKIMKDHKISEHYNLYLDDPSKVSAENLRTIIYFR